MVRCFGIFPVIFFFVLTVSVFQKTSCLHFTSKNISVEFHFDLDTNEADAQLECHYDLDGDSLYEIRWYKDAREFYRVSPQESPMTRVFRLKGVNVDMFKSNATIVYLKSVDSSSSGSYRCEVSAEATLSGVFKTFAQDTDLNIEEAISTDKTSQI